MPQQKNRCILICEICHATFEVKASLSNQRFCSWTCTRTSRDATQIPAACLYCQKPYMTYKKHPQKYCSISCGISARNKTSQNPAFTRDISGANNPMHGKGLQGEGNGMHGKTGAQNPAWRGGRKIRRDGYILVIAPDGYPHPVSNGQGKPTRYILEHRYIMEQHLGRYLDPQEVVHHKDHNPSNNTIENLELCPSQSAHISQHH